MSNEQPKKEQIYVMKGLPISAYLNDSGEFRWIPTEKTCQERETAETILEVLQKMPSDRRRVWATRLDKDETLATCPIIRKDIDLKKKFDEFCAIYDTERETLAAGNETK